MLASTCLAMLLKWGSLLSTLIFLPPHIQCIIQIARQHLPCWTLYGLSCLNTHISWPQLDQSSKLISWSACSTGQTLGLQCRIHSCSFLNTTCVQFARGKSLTCGYSATHSTYILCFSVPERSDGKNWPIHWNMYHIKDIHCPSIAVRKSSEPKQS